MTRRVLVSAVLCTALFWTALSAAEMREGLWEVSIQAELGGQPVSSTPMVVRQCMDEHGVQDMLAKLGGEGACTISDLDQRGDHARWNVNCSGQTEASGTAEADFGAEEFSGRMDLTVMVNGQSVPIAQHLKGKRVGECQ
ncbi:MAG TPA: DUF3617 family protein [Burkholderiales bacterium]|nr:DUF3617 family protein [Burkholderiales bacterium]